MPVHFHFKKGGKVVVKPIGYPGGECQRVTQALTKGMGEIVSDTPTEEASLPERCQVEIQQEHLSQ
jgi:Protein of unknown function (DUF2997)